jgi:hypothetical protein
MESIPIQAEGQVPVSLAPPAARPFALPLSRRGKQPVRRHGPSLPALVIGGAIALVAIVAVVFASKHV